MLRDLNTKAQNNNACRQQLTTWVMGIVIETGWLDPTRTEIAEPVSGSLPLTILAWKPFEILFISLFSVAGTPDTISTRWFFPSAF